MRTGRFVLLDYAGRRPEASFDSWPPELTARGDVVAGADDRGLPGDLASYIDRLVAAVSAARPDVVLGYCASAGIAAELAVALAERRVCYPTLVAFDPVVCGPADFVGAYRDIVQELSIMDAPIEIAAAELARQPELVLRRVHDDVSNRVAASLAMSLGHGADQDLVDLTAARYVRWLRYLCLAAQSRWPAGHAPVVQLCSQGYEPDLDAGESSRVVTHRLPEQRAELFASPAVHRYIAGILDGRPIGELP